MFRRLSLRSLSAAFLRGTLGLAVLGAGLAAQTERDLTTPTAAIWLNGAEVATINNWINQGYRITTLEVQDTSPYRFTVAMVRNTGAYSVPGWWWYYGVTASQMNGFLSQNNARLIDIETYVVGSTRLYAGVMVRNTGSSFKQTFVFYGSTWQTIANHVQSAGTRIVDLEPYTSGSSTLYAAVTIANTGGDARAWWWYLGASSAQIETNLQQNGARLVDIERNPGGGFDAVMVRTQGEHWWYYYTLTASGVTDRLKQNGARLIDVEPRATLLGTRYDVVMINNSNALTTRIGQILRNGTDGTTGCFLARHTLLSTSTHASLNADTVFEPASTLKTLPHVHAMRRVSQNLNNLNQTVTTFLGTSGSCPTGGGSSVQETLQTALRLMMENSDNNRTQTTVNLFGAGNINATAGTLGMGDTSINHVFGCGGPTPNATTLADLGALHRRVSTGFLGTQRQTFYDLMVNSLTYPTVGTLSINSVITQEAAKLSLPASTVSAFRSRVVHASKGGNYDWPSVPRFHGSYFSYVGLPAISSGQVAMRDYAAGVFFNDATNKTNAFNAIGTAFVEMLRDEIASALATWQGYTLGSITYFGSGCAGSAGTPLASASGTPSVASTITYSVSNAPARTVALLWFGVSNSNWGRTPLPLDLGPLGAPGCFLRTDPLLSITVPIGTLGSGSVPVNVPANGSLVGGTVYSQFWVVDSPANRLGLTTTRGIATRIGVKL